VALRYATVRVWKIPAQRWLSGGLGLLPLAPLGDVQASDLPAVIAQMKKRLDREVAPRRAVESWSATYILMGLRYDQALIQTLLQGVTSMKESVTYQAILEEGKALGEIEEAKKVFLLIARDRFGDPPPDALAVLETVSDVKKLEALSRRVLQVKNWQELLRPNGTRGRGKSRRGSS
jgi:predicted transposase YdaD